MFKYKTHFGDEGAASRFAVEWSGHFWLVFGKPRIQISAQRKAAQAKVAPDFTQSFSVN
jgi:hypothetical protein